jgi:hypothetical protein
MSGSANAIASDIARYDVLVRQAVVDGSLVAFMEKEKATLVCSSHWKSYLDFDPALEKAL